MVVFLALLRFHCGSVTLSVCVCVCRLPIPWILYGAINGGSPYTVSSKGLMCSIILLFLMLMAVIVAIALSKWRMSKVLGISMMVFYAVFVTLSVLLEYQIIKCPA